MAKELAITPRSAQPDINKLIAVGILQEATGHKRNRVYVAPEIVRTVEEAEQEL